MHIQYVGFKVAASSRIYDFHVINAPGGDAREFTVHLQSEAFQPARLRIQDGPGICFARLKQALESETQEARTEAHLSIGEQDIQAYIERYYPRKPPAKWWQGKQHDTGDGRGE